MAKRIRKTARTPAPRVKGSAQKTIRLLVALLALSLVAVVFLLHEVEEKHSSISSLFARDAFAALTPPSQSINHTKAPAVARPSTPAVARPSAPPPLTAPSPIALGVGQCELCFTPGKHCQQLILRHIQRAQSSILIQAYSFTDPEIASALVRAKQRGVDVRIILDKSNTSDHRSRRSDMQRACIPTVIDPCHGIAHNKVMIIDNKTVITGSYNFSKSAYMRNAENVLVTHNPALAQEYTRNWHKRYAVAYKSPPPQRINVIRTPASRPKSSNHRPATPLGAPLSVAELNRTHHTAKKVIRSHRNLSRSHQKRHPAPKRHTHKRHTHKKAA